MGLLQHTEKFIIVSIYSVIVASMIFMQSVESLYNQAHSILVLQKYNSST